MAELTRQQRDTLRDVKKRLGDLPKHRTGLEYAISQLGEDFTVEAVEEAFGSMDAETLQKANALQGAFENTCNNLIGLAAAVVELLGAPPGDRPSAGRDLRILKQNDVITERTRKALDDANTQRNIVQHAYIDLAPERLHAAIELFRSHIQEFVDDVVAWLHQNDMTL